MLIIQKIFEPQKYLKSLSFPEYLTFMLVCHTIKYFSRSVAKKVSKIKTLIFYQPNFGQKLKNKHEVFGQNCTPNDKTSEISLLLSISKKKFEKLF